MPTQPSYNLIHDGLDECADYVLRTLRRKGILFNVYVDRSGGVRVRPASDREDTHERPAEEFVCSYRKATACIEYIREDLAYKLAHMPKYVTNKAA